MDLDTNEQNGVAHSCDLCSLQFFSRVQLLSHRMCGKHIKKLQSNLKRGLTARCVACKTDLADLNVAGRHVQHPQHKDRMSSELIQGLFAGHQFICESCGLAFSNEIGLEVHLTMPLHGGEISLFKLPKSNEIVKQLSGLSTDLSAPSFKPSCDRICNEDFQTLDEYLLHISSSQHVRRLSMSSCLVCHKDFQHLDDRDKHLSGTKHHSTMGKLVNTCPAHESISWNKKGGFVCTYCMIWCSSWLHFELHLLSTAHTAAVSRKNAEEDATEASKKSKGDLQVLRCESVDTTRWKNWRDELPSSLSVWCHSCGEVLTSTGSAEKHLEDCHHPQNMDSLAVAKSRRLESSHSISDTSSNEAAGGVLHQCRICYMSFKVAFALSAHEALPQHQRRLRLESRGRFRWCMDCGLQVDECPEAGGELDCAANGEERTKVEAVSAVSISNDEKMATESEACTRLESRTAIVSEKEMQGGQCKIQNRRGRWQDGDEGKANGIDRQLEMEKKAMAKRPDADHLSNTSPPPPELADPQIVKLIRVPDASVAAGANALPIVAGAIVVRSDSMQDALKCAMAALGEALSSALSTLQQAGNASRSSSAPPPALAPAPPPAGAPASPGIHHRKHHLDAADQALRYGEPSLKRIRAVEQTSSDQYAAPSYVQDHQHHLLQALEPVALPGEDHDQLKPIIGDAAFNGDHLGLSPGVSKICEAQCPTHVQPCSSTLMNQPADLPEVSMLLESATSSFEGNPPVV